MAVRPAWKGYLKLSLVTCGVELSNATTQNEKVSFRILNKATGNTVSRQYIDSVTGKPVDEKNEIKGYEIENDKFLLFDEEEIDAVKIESSHTLSLERFVKKAEIEQIYLDTPYYLTPSDKVSQETFAVIRDALAEKKMAGLARIVLYRRERPVVIEALGKGMLLTTLRYDHTVRQPETVFDEIAKVSVDQEMTDLATHIIDKKKGKFDPSKFDDRYEDALLALIKAKKSGKKPPIVSTAEPPSNVVNLFDALRKSLASEGGTPSKAAKSAARGKSSAAGEKTVKKASAGRKR